MNITEIWRSYRKNRGAIVGLGITVFFVIIAVFAPFISRSPFEQGPNAFELPSLKYFAGTDDLGRDIYSGIIHGSRISLIIGTLSALTSMVIGTLIGSVSGYFGGWIDDIMMRITEIFQIIPKFFLALLIASFFGGSVWNVIFIIGILSWPSVARIVRSNIISLKEWEFVEAARALGASDFRIIFQEILPNLSAPIIISSSFLVGRAILTEASLSFLGLGDPNVMSWGYMLNNAQRFLMRSWCMSLFPGLTLFLNILGFYLMADGINEALNPKLKEE